MNKILVVLFASIMLFSCTNQKAITQKHADHIELMENEELLMSARAQYLGKLHNQADCFLPIKEFILEQASLQQKNKIFL